MKLLAFSLFAVLLVLGSCSIEPAKINYGKDACHFCKMTIVDQQHAAEAVTAKGKAYKYDAIECMINDLKVKEDIKISLLLVNDYSSPGTLIEASTSTFLISEKIKSPMGAYLSAFSNAEEATITKNLHGGTLYNWKNIQQYFN